MPLQYCPFTRQLIFAGGSGGLDAAAFGVIKVGDDLFREKAKETADKLLPAFNSPTG